MQPQPEQESEVHGLDTGHTHGQSRVSGGVAGEADTAGLGGALLAVSMVEARPGRLCAQVSFGSVVVDSSACCPVPGFWTAP